MKIGAQKSGDIIDKVACTIFEIVLQSDTKIRLKDKFNNVVSLLKNMFNQQSDIITKQEKTQNSIKQDMKNRDLNLEQKDQKLKEFNLKLLQNDENNDAFQYHF